VPRSRAGQGFRLLMVVVVGAVVGILIGQLIVHLLISR
jgi:F0F1-type ATP synthase assembly protein I